MKRHKWKLIIGTIILFIMTGCIDEEKQTKETVKSDIKTVQNTSNKVIPYSEVVIVDNKAYYIKNKKLVTGIVKGNVSENRVESLIAFRFKDGLFHGESTMSHKDGKIYKKENYMNGIKHGDFEYYSKNGETLKKETYNQGKEHGNWFTYYDGEEKKIYEVIGYKNGLKDGFHIEYDHIGNKKFEIEYKDDIYHGINRVFERDGVIKSEIEYKNGLFHGFHKTYKNGNLVTYQNFEEGKQRGFYGEYDLNGELTREVNITDSGSYHEKRYVTDSRGNYYLRFEGTYINGVLHGNVTESTKVYTQKFPVINGVIQGVYREYYEDRLTRETQYIGGRKNGFSFSYDKDGFFDGASILENDRTPNLERRIEILKNDYDPTVYEAFIHRYSNGQLATTSEPRLGKTVRLEGKYLKKSNQNSNITPETTLKKSEEPTSNQNTNSPHEISGEYKVLEKTYFHNAPSSSTVRKAFLVEGDTFTISKYEDGYGYTEFSSTKGWILLDSKVSKKER